ncbi:MAG: hypothetical protein DHS20C19_08930 [Acidimicrobiales bacterium]|nr:MAG: hypothetical protein DHS20C19_08930 [Acidimicrobiales bacterium]
MTSGRDTAGDDLARAVEILEESKALRRRPAVLESLREVVALAPERLTERLVLARYDEQRGTPDESGRAFDDCLDELWREGMIDAPLMSAFLRNAHFGANPEGTVARLERLSDVLDRVAERPGQNPRILAISRCRVLLALRHREPFLAAVPVARELAPANRMVVELADVATRWSDPGHPDHDARKVFVIGLSRTGTSSMHRALEACGLRSVHWVNRLTGALPDVFDYHLHDAFSDINVSASFESLYADFPSACFILTQRPRESWTRSIAAHYENYAGVTEPAELLAPAHEQRFGGRYGEIHRSLYSNHPTWEAAYDAFHQRVDTFFADKPAASLLRIAVTQGEGWEPLGRFLDVATPDLPFPHANALPVEPESARA